MSYRDYFTRILRDVERFLTRGPRHRQQLADVDIRVAVTGVRGKSTTVTWLYEALAARGYDVYGKVTGEHPVSLHGGGRYPIERGESVQLYETEREIARYDPDDAIVVENQGIREYTTRLVNTDYVDPTLVVLTNIRRDHLDTLGRTLGEITRSLARAIPEGSTVVCGDRGGAKLDYLEQELARRDATLVRAADPDDTIRSPADELLTTVDAALAEIGTDHLTASEREAFRERMVYQWIQLDDGRVFHAAKVNDVESTELVRRALSHDGDETITPIVYFRADRPGRSVSFVDYLNELADAGLVQAVHGIGAHRGAATRRLNVPVVWHDETAESAADVLNAALEAGYPVLTMANGVPTFMQDLKAEIETRRVLAPSEESHLEDSHQSIPGE